MGRIIIENNAFIYRESESEKVLLDCKDLMANKSRIPMHSFDGDLTIPGLILNLMKEHGQFAGKENDALEYLLIDVILISYLIRSPLPVKVLELGCVNGLLSYHLATILGKFNRKSFLCCVCDIIGNNSKNQWLDRISLVGGGPELSLLVADYDNTQLAKNNFDIVIINGTADFHDPYMMIKEAESLAKKGGMIFCYSDCQPLLESSFQLIFSEREEYTLNPWGSIMTVKCQKEAEDREAERNWHDEAEGVIEEIGRRLNGKMEKDELREMVDWLNSYIDDAIEREDLDMKMKLIRQKEILVDLIVA